MLSLLLLALWIFSGEGVKVGLKVPHFIPSGSSPTLSCLYDLEGEALYAVKWYRGHHEFFRYIPGARPQMAAFPIAGLIVDVLGSGRDKVRLVNVPKHISGKVTCEVSVEKTFKTTFDTQNLTISDIDYEKPILNISSHVFDPNVDPEITCTAQATEPPTLINFYVDYIKVPRSYIIDFRNGTAKLKKEVLLNFITTVPGGYISPIWLKCDSYLKGVFHRSSESIAIVPLATVEPSLARSASLLSSYILIIFNILLHQYFSSSY